MYIWNYFTLHALLILFIRELTCHVMGSDPQQKYPPPKSVIPPVLKYLPPPSPQTFYSPLRLEMAVSAFFTHGYFQQAHHVHISEAIVTD